MMRGSPLQRLLDEPYRFEFFSAVQLLQRWLAQQGIEPDAALTTILRFKNSTRLDFPASEIEQLTTRPALAANDTDALLAALQSSQLQNIELTPAFMGFLGGSGTLPSHYSERIAAHESSQRDAGPRNFLDTFSNRAVALFYQAWRKYRLESGPTEREQRCLPLLLSLAGVGFDSLRQTANQNDDVLDESIAYYAAALRQRPVSASVIARVLADYFGVPVRAEQFVGHWCQVPAQQCTRIGIANARLGQQALLGERVWQRDLRLRLTLGPLNRQQFEPLLPGASAAGALKKFLTLFTGITLEYEIRLLLSRHAVAGIQLDTTTGANRLGWNTFLLSAPETRDRADVQYCLL